MRLIAYILLSACVLVSCNRPPTESTRTSSDQHCIDAFDPQKDYFPDKAIVEYARNFMVDYRKSYKVVTVRHPTEGGPDERYVLLQCGAPRTVVGEDLAGAPVVVIPITSMFSASLTHLPLLVDLGHVDVLSGIGQTRFVTAEPVLERIRAGGVTEFAPNNVTDAELVISKAPAILMTSGGESAEYGTIRKAGIAVVSNAEWQESTALGRAEWVKYMALFLNEEALASRLFDAIRDRYLLLKERTQSIPETMRPRVMAGVANRGDFEIAGGRSYVATMIQDAGGRYVWADNPSTGFAVVSMESQIERAADADVWINGGAWSSREAMLREEPRYRQFKAYRSGAVWLYNRLLNADGGNDYWSRGGTRPDLILSDLVKILHPQLAKDHEFVWYKQVPVE